MARYGADDPMVAAFLAWAIDLMGAGSWKRRRRQIDARLGAGGVVRGSPSSTGLGPAQARAFEDVAAWYLVQCERYLNDGAAYDVMLGSRVLPIVQRLGASIGQLQRVEGAETRLRRTLRKNPAEMDSTLFELLVALAYVERSSAPVAFLPEAPGQAKTPDLRVGGGADPFFVECKRKYRTSQYAQAEYRHFAEMYEPVRADLRRLDRSWAVDCVFHQEMSSYGPAYLARRVAPMLVVADAGVGYARTLIDDPDVTVTVRAADWEKYERELGSVNVRGDTPQLHHVLFGYDEPWRGYQASVAGWESEQAPGYYARVTFASVGIWSCDAPQSVQAKARHFQAEVSKAFEQLPNNAPGAAHVATETYDSDHIADERVRRLTEEMWNGLEISRRKLQWVYVHLFAFNVPPDQSWDAGETCVFFPPSDPGAVAKRLSPKLLLEPAAPLPAVRLVRRSP
jgi:hypothetical protein